jgi:hypothetical protein
MSCELRLLKICGALLCSGCLEARSLESLAIGWKNVSLESLAIGCGGTALLSGCLAFTRIATLLNDISDLFCLAFGRYVSLCVSVCLRSHTHVHHIRFGCDLMADIVLSPFC